MDKCPLSPRQREVSGILLFSMGVFALVSLYVQTTGAIGLILRDYLRLAVGQVAAAFGFFVVLLSLHLFRGSLWPLRVCKVAGYFLLGMTMITLFHMLTVYQGYQLPPSLEEELRYARNGQGAGVVGAVLMVVFLSAFGLPGSYIMLGSLLLVGLILVSDLSLISVTKSLFATFVSGTRRCVGFFLAYLAGKRDDLESWREKRQLARLARLNDAVQEVEEPTVAASAETTPELEDAAFTEQLESAEGGTMAMELAVDVDPGPDFRFPPLYLLKKSASKHRLAKEESQKMLLEETFSSFSIDAKVVNICQGPVVTRYELQPAPGVKVSRITALADDLALSLAAADVRIEAPVPGKSVVGIEVPNRQRASVLLRDVLDSPEFGDNASKVSLALGKDIAGNPVVADLKKWLHLLIAGSTGSGKSVCLNAIIASLLFKASPDQVKILMIDPKRVELAIYDGIPHLISPVVTDPKKAATALRWAVVEMERRYKIFSETGVRNIDMYTSLRPSDPEEPLEHLPYIVIIIDELADLMMVAAGDVEDAICRIAQMARAAGMYLVIATQRPSVDVITGLIKANVPSRIAFAVSSQIDSRTILDKGGAERLIGKGDMLIYPVGASKPSRAQGAWIADEEVEALVKFWKNQADPEYTETVVPESVDVGSESLEDDDELLEDAVTLVTDTGQASISMLQRRFRIGHSRAARLIDMMEVRGIVGPYQGSKPREVLLEGNSSESTR